MPGGASDAQFLALGSAVTVLALTLRWYCTTRSHITSQAVEMAREGFGEDDPHMASACNNLAEFYRIRRQYDAAEPLYRQVRGCGAGRLQLRLLLRPPLW